MYSCKDKPYRETVEKVKNILCNYGIEVEERDTTLNNVGTFSVRIYLKDMPQIGCNGKGSTYDAALASGYAEFMERLQNFCLYKLPENMQHFFDFIWTPDEEKLSPMESGFYKKYLKCASVEKELKKLNEISSGKNLSIPFYNVCINIRELVPLAFVFNLYGSNGMCAGNNFYEACVNGLSEIFERFVNIDIYKSGRTLYSLNLQNLDIGEDIREKLRKLGNLYSIEIKDCSLEGKYPVIGLLITDKRRERYIFKLASHPILTIAIEKAFNEVFQGNDELDNSLFRDYNFTENYYRSIESILVNGTASYSIINFKSDVRKIPKVFLNDKFYSNKEMYEYIIALIKKMGKEVLIRDVSFMGFPSYQIIVPGLSEIYKYTSNDLQYVIAKIENEREKSLKIESALENKTYIQSNSMESSNIYKMLDIYFEQKSMMSLETVDFYNFRISILKGHKKASIYFLGKYIQWLKECKYSKLENYYTEMYHMLMNEVYETETDKSTHGSFDKLIKQQIQYYQCNYFELPCSGYGLCSQECINRDECQSSKVIKLHQKLLAIYINNIVMQSHKINYNELNEQ